MKITLIHYSIYKIKKDNICVIIYYFFLIDLIVFIYYNNMKLVKKTKQNFKF